MRPSGNEAKIESPCHIQEAVGSVFHRKRLPGEAGQAGIVRPGLQTCREVWLAGSQVCVRQRNICDDRVIHPDRQANHVAATAVVGVETDCQARLRAFFGEIHLAARTGGPAAAVVVAQDGVVRRGEAKAEAIGWSVIARANSHVAIELEPTDDGPGVEIRKDDDAALRADGVGDREVAVGGGTGGLRIVWAAIGGVYVTAPARPLENDETVGRAG